MASTARAYEPRRRYEGNEGYEQVAPRRPRPRIEVRPGGRGELEAASRRAVAVFKIVIVTLAAIAVMSVARIWLTNASMDTLSQASEVNSSIEDARSLGTQLEVQYYAAANPAKVKTYAADELGMAAAAVASTSVDLTPDAIKQAIPSTVTGGIAACESAIAQREAENLAQAGRTAAVDSVEDMGR